MQRTECPAGVLDAGGVSEDRDDGLAEEDAASVQMHSVRHEALAS